MIGARAIVLAPIWGMAVIAGGLFARIQGPGVEITLWPILTDQHVGGQRRTIDMACWDWSYHKARGATLLRKEQFVERDDGVRFPAPEYRPDLGIPSNDSTSAKAGVTRTIPECVLVPDSLRETRHFWVRGNNTYLPWHGLWPLTQPIAPVEFDVPPVPARSILPPP